MKNENFHAVKKSISQKASALSNGDEAKSMELKQKMFDLTRFLRNFRFYRNRFFRMYFGLKTPEKII
jgi:hypothetical protein